MATQAQLDAAFAWAKAQVGKPYVLDGFGSTFDCSTYMSGIATMIRDGKASRWFTTWSFKSGARNPMPGWELGLEAPFMVGVTDDNIGHTGGTLLGTEFEATAAGNRVVRMGDVARGAKDPMYDWVYGYRPSILEGDMATEYTTYTIKSTDTLATVATAYKTTVDILASENGLTPVGKSLVVVDPATTPDPPTQTPLLHIVAAGDTWDSIAIKYGLTVSALLALNEIVPIEGERLTVGYTTTPSEPKPIDPYVDGLPKAGMASPSSKRLQMELKRVGYLADSVELADNYGPLTQSAVAAFHNDNTQFRSPDLTYDPQIGTSGWLYLRGMADDTGVVTKSPAQDTTGQLAVNDVTYVKSNSGSGRAVAEASVRSALTVMGLPVTQAWIDGYLTMALRESSYNPNAVNTYDSNAKNVSEINGGQNAADGNPGQCSRGMWQCIPQTFARYHQAGTSLSIYDPVASAASSINYVRAVYGVANDGSNLSSRVQQSDPTRVPRGY